MLKEKFSSMWVLRLSATFLVVIVSALVAWGVDEAEIPFWTTWMNSGHADPNAEAFKHWDEDLPPEIPTRCAKCHSTFGHLDFLGVDGTDFGTVDNPAPIGTTVECIACHNEATAVQDSVVFPSGVEVTGLGSEARCMNCHQGRESSVSVDQRIADANVPDDDTISPDLGFANIHYYAAAATRFGGIAKGGYQYAGKSYDAKFAHVAGVDTCTSCHDPHSLEIQLDSCTLCHEEVAVSGDVKNIRLFGSTSDYDGDGDVSEGIYYEIEGLREILLTAIQEYAAVAGTPIVYDAHSYPYFFIDTDGNGQADEGEANYDNRYKAFSPRLLRATYNYQTSLKDPGAFAHGGKYIIQLLYDSIEDLNPDLVIGLSRIDAGHFAGSEEAWRHWDDDGEVSASCGRCHSATGLPFLLETGVTISQPISNGMLCTTCHDSLPEFTRYVVNEVQMPSGNIISFGEGDDSNLCMSCHQGRQSTVSVNEFLAGKNLPDDDTVDSSISFRNVHYFVAGATLFGTEAQGAYEYEGKVYNGRFNHTGSLDSCIECHDAHNLQVREETCNMCHKGTNGPEDIRIDNTDYDGDGDTNEGIDGEIKTYEEILLGAIQLYAEATGNPIVYDSHRYPYFFHDTNGNGVSDEGEANYGNRYKGFTVRLLQATYNYQYSQKDPGGYAHNGKYVIQILHDSIENLATQVTVDTTGLTRP